MNNYTLLFRLLAYSEHPSYKSLEMSYLLKQGHLYIFI